MVSESLVSTVKQTVCNCFAAITEVPADTLDLDANIFEVYGLDSMNALKLISDIEVEFDIDIEQEEARQLRTLNDVIKLIQLKSDQT